jgi:hypothetical protein
MRATNDSRGQLKDLCLWMGLPPELVIALAILSLYMEKSRDFLVA